MARVDKFDFERMWVVRFGIRESEGKRDVLRGHERWQNTMG
jgi:hypothetical protein